MAYRVCCRPFHEGAEPPDPERMMRSRFAAFALGDGDYLWRTSHPDHPIRARPRDEAVTELSQARRTLRYQRLVVHDTSVDGDEGRVLFTAHVFEKGKDQSFTELSEFSRVDGAWRYRDGVARAGSGRATIQAFLEAR